MTSQQEHLAAAALPARMSGLHRRAQGDDLIGIDVRQRRRCPSYCSTNARTAGVRVAPPTKITPSRTPRTAHP